MSTASAGRKSTSSIVSSLTGGDLARLHSYSVGLYGDDDDDNDCRSEASLLEPLVGREEEQKQLADAFQKVKNGASSQVMLLSGPSGVGKSALAQSLRNFVFAADGYFVDAKFDQVRLNLPFSALSDVLSDLCDLLVQDTDRLPRIRARLATMVEPGERAALSLVVSDLSQLTGEVYAYDAEQQPMLSQQSFCTFKVACKLFLRAIATEDKNHPVVMFLDDLQWADAESLAVLRLLATDLESRNILFIVAYRNDESHSLLTIEDTFGVEKDEQGGWLPRTFMNVTSLGRRQVNKFVSSKLHMDPTLTMALSDLLLRKTHGNPFFLGELLGSLQVHNLILYDGTQWTWDLESIQSQIDVTDNVLRLLEQKLHRIPRQAQELLAIAAMIGFSFSTDILLGFLADNDVPRLLAVAAKEGFIEAAGAGQYRFGHDKVQQCLLEVIHGKDDDDDDDENRRSIQRRLGWYLYEKSEQCAGDNVVFAAADNLNEGLRSIADSQRIDVAKLNLAAGIASKTKSSYRSAAEYAGRGLHALGANLPWENHYDLTLQLCNLSAESECCLGNFVAALDVVDEIVLHAKTSLDKVLALKTSIDAIAGLGDVSLALQRCVAVVRELGDVFPRKPNAFSTISQLKRSRKVMKGLSDSEILGYPKLDDKKVLAIIQIHASMQLFAIMINEKFYIICSAMRCLEISFTIGCSYATPFSIVTYGIVNRELGNHASARRCWNLAAALARDLGFKRGQCKTALMMHGCCMHYIENIRNSIEPLHSAVLDGLASGDIEEAFLASGVYAANCFTSSIPLSDLQSCLTILHDRFSEHNNHSRLLYLAVLTMVLKMKDKSNDPTELTSFAMQETCAMGEAAASKDRFMISYLLAFKMILQLHFGDSHKALVIALSLIKFKFPGLKLPNYYMNVFYCGMVFFQQYRETAKRKYLVLARRKSIRILRKYKSSPNGKPLLLLLQAENAVASHYAVEEVQTMFEAAIRSASNAGFQSIEALASERAADAMVHLGESTRKVSLYMTQAIQLYGLWEADTKVRYLEELQQVTANVTS